MPRRHSRRAALVVIVAMLALAFSGCQMPFGPHLTVSGTIFGEQVAARQAGKSVPMPLRATITCNGMSAASNGDGTFSISVSQSNKYTCTATAPNYSSVTASFSGKGNAFTLSFGPKRVAQCKSDASAANAMMCGVLPPATATLRGTVTNADTDKALSDVLVKCWSRALDDISTGNGSTRITATTDSLGHYVIRNLPVDPYGCVADTDQTLQTTTLSPGQTTTLDIPVCDSACSHFSYHLGKVVHHLTAYLIFWLPSGYTFEPNGSDSRFQRLLAQYFQDVGGTPFYNILSQYYDDVGGPVRNVATLGGTYLDTASYPKAGTVNDPLLDSDIAHEISRVLALKQGDWVVDDDHIVFVVTGYNVQECSGTDASAGCTFLHNREADFCAYHYYSADNVIYAYLPVVDGCLNLPTTQSPNNDSIADAVISTASHEQFEAVSDPSLDGWYDNATNEGEMADKCVRNFGSIGPDGGNITLNNHRYIVQEEWSLRDQGCVLALS